jgi:uncharacterized membrane protein YciS (DUF1049 family)
MVAASFSPALAFFLLLLTAAAAIHFFHLKKTYYAGISLWSRWLPVAATGIYLATLTVNLFAGGKPEPVTLSLSDLFSMPEMTVLLIAGPVFLTRIGNFVGAVALAYVMEKMLMTPGAETTPAFFLMTGSTAIVAVLSDRMPWLSIEGLNHFAEKMREILLIALTVGALAVVFSGIIKVHGFSRWLAQYGFELPAPLMMLLLVGLFIGWLSVALGFTRNFTIPLLSLPTLFVVAYISEWPAELLIVPFVLSLALSLAAAERRLRRTRRSSTLSGSLFSWR